ncbi:MULTISPECIES: hypothetical protein [Planktothrix]|jgi:hypothetical protein|uniref:hypothetical protein n=2 Tax=Planktothrix TaxID=54304 RepID=UPI0003FEEA79|nr:MULTISPECIES: hypothetical protein [Planktothrix]
MYLNSKSLTSVDNTPTSIDPLPEFVKSKCSIVSFSTCSSLNQPFHSLSHSGQENMINSSDQERENQGEMDHSYVELTIDVLRAQNREYIQALKDFLTVLPNPGWIELVLIKAIYQLAEIDRDACSWVLDHSSYLMPELDVNNYAVQSVCFKLQSQGFIFNQDFWFAAPLQLELTKNAELELWQDVSIGDRLIIEEILKIHDS